MCEIRPEDISDAEVREWYRHKLQKNLPGNDQYPVIVDKYPSLLEIESTSRCNVNPPCPMCVRSIRTTENEFDMPFHLLRWLGNPIASARETSISGIGEPMMSKDFGYLISLTHSGRLTFFSNGQVITDENIGLIIDGRVSHINFSLDAATAETYYKIRGIDLSTFDRVISNIKRLVTERIVRGLTEPSIHLIMVVMKENYQELPDLVRLASSIGVEGVRYWQLRSPSVPSDYKYVDRNGFSFSYEEQSEMPELDLVVAESENIAKASGLFFAEN